MGHDDSTLEPRMFNLNETVTGIAPMLSRLFGSDIEILMKLSPRLPTILGDQKPFTLRELRRRIREVLDRWTYPRLCWPVDSMSLEPTPQTLLSITSIPRRFDTSLHEAVSSLATTREHILVSIPLEYKKWGRAVPPLYLKNMSTVIVFQPSTDYGPATKLLGALEYLRTVPSAYKYIITFDDDVCYSNPQRVIDYYKQQAAKHPGCVITVGGIKLDHHPYHADDGLLYDNIGYVDVVAGYLGVLYPTSIFNNDDRVFQMMHEMPAGIFNEDDGYFGICLSRMNVPIYAARQLRHDQNGNSIECRDVMAAGPSAVGEQSATDRKTNEMEIFQYAVARGWLPSKRASAASVPGIIRKLRRNKIASRIIRLLKGD